MGPPRSDDSVLGGSLPLNVVGVVEEHMSISGVPIDAFVVDFGRYGTRILGSITLQEITEKEYFESVLRGRFSER